MRTCDHRSAERHIAAMARIKPICNSMRVYIPVQSEDATCVKAAHGYKNVNEQIVCGYLVQWKGNIVPVGVTVGQVVDGEPMVNAIGRAVVSGLLGGKESIRPLVIGEFSQVATGDLKRLARRLGDVLTEGVQKDAAAVMLLAKNSTMYDKLVGLIGGLQEVREVGGGV